MIRAFYYPADDELCFFPTGEESREPSHRFRKLLEDRLGAINVDSCWIWIDDLGDIQIGCRAWLGNSQIERRITWR